MILGKIIRKLRVNSLLLFLIPAIAIIGSLQIHNFLINFKYSLLIDYSYLTDVPGEEYKVNCTEDNNYCVKKNPQGYIDIGALVFNEVTLTKISNCFTNHVEGVFINNGKNYPVTNMRHPQGYREQIVPTTLFYLKGTDAEAQWVLKDEFINNKIEFKKYVTNKKDATCIKNDPKYYFLYKYVPPITYLIDQKTKTYKSNSPGIILGTNVEVNPFLYGEVSISNLVKRFPINIFFKFFLYIGVILMIMYWNNYNSIFKIILYTKKNIFYFFGLGSAVLLFLHIYFLGTTSNNEILKNFRRIVIVLFILFEVIAQTLLAFKIYKNKDNLSRYCYKLIVLTKIFFVSFIVVFTVIILIILSIFNLSSSFDYILEWNYFIVLLIFYLLSSLMWKKINF